MKTQADLLEELRRLRRRVAELELAAGRDDMQDAPTPFPAADETITPGTTVSELRSLDERQQAYARLLKQTKLLQSMFDAVAEGIVVCDQQGRFLQFNPAASDIIGRGAQNTSPQNWSSLYGLFLPDRVTPFPVDQLPLVRSLRGEDVDGVEMYIRHEGRPQGLWISVTARPLRDAEDQIRGAIAVLRDITDAKAARAAVAAKQELLQHLLAAHERDRTLTAYEIHDGLVQDMTGALLHLSHVAELLFAEQTEAAESLATARKVLEQGIGEARRVISGLRPPVLDREGVLPAIVLLVRQKSTPEQQIEFVYDPIHERLPAIVEGTLYRIVQECLNNVARHSQARRVSIELRLRDDQLRLTVCDDGVGFNAAEVPRERYGLMGIRERAKLLGGTARITSRPGTGTLVAVTLPIAGPPSEAHASSPVDETT